MILLYIQVDSVFYIINVVFKSNRIEIFSCFIFIREIIATKRNAVYIVEYFIIVFVILEIDHAVRCYFYMNRFLLFDYETRCLYEKVWCLDLCICKLN